MTKIEALPELLRKTGLFCLWKYEERDGKKTKVPYNPNAPKERAQANNRYTFAVLDLITNAAGFDGLGVGVFDDLAGIDIDHCVKGGELSAMAKDIVATMDAYTEISPSGEGLRILFKARGLKYDKDRYYIKNSKAGLEVYVSGMTNRFLTVTGNAIRNADLVERSDQLKAVLDKYMQRPQPERQPVTTTASAAGLTDAELLERAEAARNGAAFRALWAGDISGYPSQSEADQALCNMLAFWTGRDADRMDALFRQSGLMRDKWNRRQSGRTYGKITIEKAIQSCGEIYEPKQDPGRDQGRALDWNSTIHDQAEEEEQKPTEGAALPDGVQDPGEQAQTSQAAPKDNPAQPGRKRARLICAAELFEKDIPDLEWLVPGWLPAEGVSVISALPKVGKSWLVLQISLALSRGGKFFGKQCEQHTVAYLDLEGGERRAKNRLSKMGVTKEDLKRLYILSDESHDVGIIGNGFEDWARDIKQDCPEMKLLIIDIFQLIRPAPMKNGNAYHNDVNDLKALDALAKSLNIAILVVHHNNKAKNETDVFNKMSGSTGMSGAVSCMWQIDRARFSNDATISISGNDIEDEAQLSVYFDKEHTTWVYRGDREELAQKRIDIEYFKDPQVEAVKKIVDSMGTWKGTYKDFCALSENYDFQFDTGAQAAKKFSQNMTGAYMAHLANDGYLVQMTHRRNACLYTLQRADGNQQAVDLFDFGEQDELQV